MGSPGAPRGTGWETPTAARARRDWTAGKWGGDRAQSQQHPGEQRGQAKDPGGLPQAARDFWLLQGAEQDPLDELGTTKPREPGPLLAPQMAGEGGLSLWPAGQPAALGNGAALGPAPRGGGCSQTPCALECKCTPRGRICCSGAVWGSACPKTSCPRQDPLLPQDTAPHENLLGHGSTP